MSLLLDFNDLHKGIKKIAVDAVEASKPVRIMYGTVTKSNPLQINVEQRLVLDKPFLIVTDHLSRKETRIRIPNTDDHVDVVFDNRLKVNDKVILLREQGGQKYIVLDKVVS